MTDSRIAADTTAFAGETHTYADPTTNTPFPTTLKTQTSATLQLIGTGVRTVSFLSVRVYSAGFYLSPGALSKPQLKGYTPDRLMSPSPDDEGLVGEALIDSLLEDTNAAVVIGESLRHARGFAPLRGTRSLGRPATCPAPRWPQC